MNNETIIKLPKQVEEMKSQLESIVQDKASKVEVYLKSIGININDFDEPTREAILSNNNIDINYVLGNANVKPNNTTFFEENMINLFDKSKVTLGYMVNYLNGNLQLQDGYCATDFIPVTPNVELKLTEYHNGAWYDSSKKFIVGAVESQRIPPSNAKYYRSTVSISKIDTTVIANKDIFPVEYVPYGITKFTITNEELKKEIYNVIDNEKIKPNNTTFFEENMINLFDKSKASDGFYIDYDRGILKADSDYCASDFIEVKPFMELKLTEYHNGAWYDSSKKFIVGVMGIQRVAPSNAKYYRSTFTSTKKDTAMISRFDLFPSEYVPYGITKLKFATQKIRDDITEEIGVNNLYELKNKKWCVVGDSITQKQVSPSKQYYDYISEKTGCQILNFGKSGTGYLTKYFDVENICDRISMLPVDVDYVTVFAGTNDTGQPLGVYGDKTKETLYGAIDYVCSSLILKYPLKKIALFTPLKVSEPQGETNKRYLIAQAIKRVAKDYAIPVLDLEQYGGLKPWIDINNKEFYGCKQFPNGDGLHPNEKGHLLLSKFILNFLESI